MPLGPITIETGDAIPGTFTYTAVNGTAPYTYQVTFNGLEGSGIVANIGGAGSNEVTFDSTLARAGTYVIEILGSVIDDVGDRDAGDPDDIETYTITVNPITATWDVGSLTIPLLDLGVTSTETATLTQQTGGAAPYVYSFSWVGGSPPHPGLSIVTSGASNNTVAIAANSTMPAGDYSGTIRGQISDATGQVEGPFDIPMTVTVVGLSASYDASQMSISGEFGNQLTSAVLTLSGSGGVAPYTFIHNWFPTIPDQDLSLVIAGLDNETVQIQAENTLPVGSYSGLVRGEVKDSAGNRALVDVPWSVEISLPVPASGNTYSEVFDAITPAPEHYWLLDEVSGDFIDSGATGGIQMNDGTNRRWRRAPGPIRGLPREYAIWFNNTTNSGLGEIGGPVNSAVGAFSCWFLGAQINTERPIFDYHYNNDLNQRIRAGYTAAGRLFLEVYVNGVGNSLRTETAIDTVSNGIFYHIAFIQRADGNGPTIIVNDGTVNVSNVTNGTATLDSWSGDFASSSPSDFALMGIGSTPTTTGNSIIQRPALWVGASAADVPANQDFINLYNASNLGADPTDYYESVMDIIGPGLGADAKYIIPFWETEFTNQFVSMGSGNNNVTSSGWTASPPELNRRDHLFQSDYNSIRADYSENDQAALSGTTNMTADTTGTIMVWLGIRSITGVRKFFSQGTNAVREMEVGLDGDRLYCRVEIAAGHYEKKIKAGAAQSLRAEINKSYQFAVVQDGASFELWVNGVKAEAADYDVSSSGTGAATWWLETLDTDGGLNDTYWGGTVQSITTEPLFPAAFIDAYYTSKALSDAEVLQLYNEVGTRGAFDDYLTGFTRTFDWTFDEASGAALNNGTATSQDIPVIAEPAGRQAQNGDVSGSTTQCAELIDTDGWGRAAAFSSDWNMSTGSLIAVWMNTGPDAGENKVMSMENDSGFYTLQFGMQSDSDLYFELFQGVVSHGGIIIGPDIANSKKFGVLVVSQAGDGTGPEMFWNGVSQGKGNFLSNGYPDVWLADIYTSATKIGLGGTTAVGGGSILQGFTGYLDRVYITPDVLTAADALELAQRYG